MNMKVCQKLKPGAIVRESFDDLAGVGGDYGRRGLVLCKKFVRTKHEAKILGGVKDKRYDVVVHWFDGPRRASDPNPKMHQCWELMLVSHAK